MADFDDPKEKSRSDNDTDFRRAGLAAGDRPSVFYDKERGLVFRTESNIPASEFLSAAEEEWGSDYQRDRAYRDTAMMMFLAVQQLTNADATLRRSQAEYVNIVLYDTIMTMTQEAPKGLIPLHITGAALTIATFLNSCRGAPPSESENS